SPEVRFRPAGARRGSLPSGAVGYHRPIPIRCFRKGSHGRRMPMSTEENAAVDPHKGEVVASIAYVNGRRDREGPTDEVGQYVNQDRSMLWVGLRNPSPELLGQVARELGACDKNQEEMLEPHRRPKIIDYGNMVLIVAITVEVEAERPIFGETQFLI